MHLGLVIEIVNMIVGVIMDSLAGLNSRIVVNWKLAKMIFGNGVFTREVLPKFRQTRTNSRLEF